MNEVHRTIFSSLNLKRGFERFAPVSEEYWKPVNFRVRYAFFSSWTVFAFNNAKHIVWDGVLRLAGRL
jgi:hypothetical protein